jgi:hypothetical protein
MSVHRHNWLFLPALQALKDDYGFHLDHQGELEVLSECEKAAEDVFVMNERRATNIVLVALSEKGLLI